MVLNQKQGLTRREFELRDNVLKIKSESPFGDVKEWSVKVENLGEDKFYQSNSKTGITIFACLLCAFVFFMTVAFLVDTDKAQNIWVLLAIYALFGGPAIWIFLTPVKKEIHLLGGSSQVSFLRDCPSQQIVEKFIDELIQKTRKLLIEKYSRIDPDLPEDTQMNQLNWLKNKDLISEETYEQLKLEYKSKKQIGRLLQNN